MRNANSVINIMKKVQNNQRIIEIKQYLDKPSKSYECEFIQLKNDVLLTKYYINETTDIFSKGVITYGFFWLKRNYISYSFYDSSNSSHLASRYDVCTNIEFNQKPFMTVSFLDLYLDYWFKDDKIYWEDDKEFLDAKLNNIIDLAQIDIIENTKIELEKNILKLEKEKKAILNN